MTGGERWAFGDDVDRRVGEVGLFHCCLLVILMA